MVASSHFDRLSKALDKLCKDGFITDCSIVTDQGPVEMHKIVLFAFSSYQREICQGSKTSGHWVVEAKGFNRTDVENFVHFLYDSDISQGSRIREIIKSLKLDLTVDKCSRKKKIQKDDSVENLLNLELKYLRNLTFEMEIPKFLKQPGLHADICIKTECDIHQCHRIILSACSKYFEVMFSSGMKESSDDTVNLQGVRSDIFTAVLTFMYTGFLAATISNIQDLLQTAVYLQTEILQGVCEEFLLRQVDTDNCVDMWSLGCTYNCQSLTEGAWNFIVDWFNKIPKTKLLSSLKQADMICLLSDDNLSVNDEKEVLAFILEWISSNKRPDVLDNLIEVVRLVLVDPAYLNDIVKNNSAVLQNEKCLRLIEGVTKGDDNSTTVIKTRKEKAFVVIKRSSYTTGIEVACYSLSQKKWFSLQSHTNCAGGTGYSTCVAGDSIFVTGGTATPKGIFQYSVNENKWYELPEMLEGRSSHGVGHVDGFIYVLGGSDVSSGTFNILSSIEKYDMSKKCWKKVGNMDIPTYDSAYSVVKSRLYLFGGSMGLTSGVYIKDIQCFDTVTDTCTILYHNLPFTLSLAMACCQNKDIYITCPNGKLVHYNEETMPSVINQTSGLQLMGYATLFHDQAIFIMGGYSMRGESDAIHRFDLKTHKEQLQTTQIKLPFKKQSNQLFASVMHISRRFLTEENVLRNENPVKGRQPSTCLTTRH